MRSSSSSSKGKTFRSDDPDGIFEILPGIKIRSYIFGPFGHLQITDAVQGIGAHLALEGIPGHQVPPVIELPEQVGVHLVEIRLVLVKGQVVKTEHLLFFNGADQGVEIFSAFDLLGFLKMNEVLPVC